MQHFAPSDHNQSADIVLNNRLINAKKAALRHHQVVAPDEK